jgi:hypothetical protein
MLLTSHNRSRTYLLNLHDQDMPSQLRVSARRVPSGATATTNCDARHRIGHTRCESRRPEAAVQSSSLAQRPRGKRQKGSSCVLNLKTGPKPTKPKPRPKPEARSQQLGPRPRGAEEKKKRKRRTHPVLRFTTASGSAGQGAACKTTGVTPVVRGGWVGQRPKKDHQVRFFLLLFF